MYASVVPHSRESLGAFSADGPDVSTRANGQPALGTYAIDPERGQYLPLAIDVLTFRGDRVADVTVFRTPEVFPRFDPPPRVEL